MTTQQRASSDHDSQHHALLVTPPHCVAEIGDCSMMAVEGEMLQPANVPSTPPVTKKTLLEESFFGANEKEMQELQALPPKGEPITHILPGSSRGKSEAGFDVCNEYGYKYGYSVEDDDDNDEDDDDDDERDQVTSSAANLKVGGGGVPILSLDTSPESQAATEHTTIHLLGIPYHPIHDYALKRNDESSLFWFTYRINFPEIVPYRITTDAGWGCMLRSAQMMLAHALRVHIKGRQWKPPSTLAQRRQDLFVNRIMTLFADYPSKTECVFSLHNMVATGLAKYETFPGEWYGPAKACHVLRDLCLLYEQQADSSMFRVHVAAQASVYRDTVHELMTKNQQTTVEQETTPAEPLSHPLDPMYTAEAEKEQSSSRESLPWDTALLLLVPLRLGLDNFNQDYTIQLATMFSFPQSVGILGGRPRGARWFYGASGTKLYGLDPHTIQVCPGRRTVKGGGKKVVCLTDDYLRSVHTNNPECINLEKLDPSLALGFYCKDNADFDNLCESMQSLAIKQGPEIFTVADKAPDYSGTTSSAMNEMLMSMATMDASDGADGQDEEDDYVLL